MTVARGRRGARLGGEDADLYERAAAPWDALDGRTRPPTRAGAWPRPGWRPAIATAPRTSRATRSPRRARSAPIGSPTRSRASRPRAARLDDDPPQAPADEPAEDPFGLTPRERQVLELLADGRTNREIGQTLFMAEKTASVHVSRILSKLDVRSRTEAAAVAHRLGLLPTAPMRALVTGATGFVGGGLASALAARGAEVRCLVRDRGRAAPLAQAGHELHEGDVLDAESLRGAGQGVSTAYYLVHSMGRGGDARASRARAASGRELRAHGERRGGRAGRLPRRTGRRAPST